MSRNGGRLLPAKFVGEAELGFLDPMESVCLRTASMEWNVPGKYGPHGELFFILIQKELATVPVSETFSPFFNADIRILLFSADPQEVCAPRLARNCGRDGDGCHVPALGDERKMGCPNSPMWESEGEAWSEDEHASSSNSREGNVCNDALHVVGLYGPGDKIFFFPAGLGAGKGGIELSHGPGHAVPGIEGVLVAGPPLPENPSFLSWTGCDKNGEGCGERKEGEGTRTASSIGQFLSKVLLSDTVCFWSEGFPSFLCATMWCSQF